MKKILLVSHSQKAGGAERCLIEAAVGLRSVGFDVHMLIPSQGPISDILSANSIAYSIASYPWWVHFNRTKVGLYSWLKRILSHFKYYSPIAKLIAELKPDFVLSNTLCVPMAAIACKLQGRKHYWFIHEYGEEDHGLIFDLGFYLSSRIIAKTSDHIFVNSTAIKDKFSTHINKGKFSVVQYDIIKPQTEAQVANVIPSDKSIRLLLVGQINSNKGQLDAVQALEILLKRGYQCKLSIVGQIADKAYFEALQLFIAERGIQQNIEFINHSSDPFQSVRSLTIGLMCSQWEALGRVTIEYMKLGLPVIAANSGTTASLIRDGDNGLLYSLRDPSDLAKKVEFLMQDQHRLDGIIKRAKEFARENFNSERFVNGLTSQLR